MKSAREMFEELGYVKSVTRDDGFYYTNFRGEWDINIKFDTNLKGIWVSHIVSMEVLQAINQMCKELGWVE